jgi:hypothetical protein
VETGSMNDAWSIIYYSHREHLHARHIRAANPHAQIMLLDTRNDLPIAAAWRAGDRLVRQALQREFHAIQHDNVLVIEWDVLLTAALPQTSIVGVQFSVVPTPESVPGWAWWPELAAWDSPCRGRMVGGVPFGVFAIDRHSLGRILDPRLDQAFESDVFSEVRFPSVCDACEIPVSTLEPSFFNPERILGSTTAPEVEYFDARFGPCFFTDPGLYHPVKYPVSAPRS